MQTMTARAAIQPYLTQHPEYKYAITENALGVWIESERRYVPFAGLTLTGTWVYMPEILINNQKIIRNWIELSN